MPVRSQPYLQSLSHRVEIKERNGYPYNIPAVKDIEAIRFHPNVTFFVGENGSGKSTILEAIAIAMGFASEGGTKSFHFETTPKSVSTLHLRLNRGTPKTTDEYFLRAESFFNVSTYLDNIREERSTYFENSFHSCSHGEAFLKLLTTHFKGDGLYLLDEPEAALSPSRQLAAICAINRLVNDSSQLIIATHSPILLAYPLSTIIHFGEEGLSKVKYEDTDHYTITRNFLNNPSRQIELLLNE